MMGLAFLSLAAVTKKQNPILDTQTDPVSYQEKQREEAEGRKGPAAPTLEFFPRQRFLTDAPVAGSKTAPAESDKGEESDLDLWLEEDEAAGGDEFKEELQSDDTWEDVSEAGGEGEVEGAFLTP